jgi:PAS domain S-box-containing protein
LVVRVTDKDRAAYEQARRQEGLPHFVIFERDAAGNQVVAKRRADYFPVHYIEPLAGNKAALGFDIGSTPSHFQAIIRAIDSGQPVVTGRVALVPETSQFKSILVLVPIYREGGLAESLAAHRAGFVAFASGVLRMGDALRQGLKALGRQEDIELYLFDVIGRDDAELLAFHPSISGPQTLSMNTALTSPTGLQTGIYYTETLSVYGRQWQVLVRPGPAYVVARREWNSWIYMLVGLALTGILLYYLSSRQRGDSRLKQAESELRRLNNTLARRVVDHTAAEERARQSEERFRSMIENVKDHSIIMLDASGCVITWNNGAERLRGYHSDEIIGKHYSCLFPKEDGEIGKAEQILSAARSDGQCEEEGWRLRKDGSRFWADVVVTAVRDADGNLLGFSSVTRDLTQRKLVQDELKLAKEAADAANQAKSAFLANISHEIRTPMAGIIGMVGLLFDTNLSPNRESIVKLSADPVNLC